jgi:hypothetical protein
VTEESELERLTDAAVDRLLVQDPERDFLLAPRRLRLRLPTRASSILNLEARAFELDLPPLPGA